MSKVDKPTAMDFPASAMRFVENFDDESGIKYEVGFDVNDEGREVWFLNAPDMATFPVDKLDWLIDCLLRIREEAP